MKFKNPFRTKTIAIAHLEYTYIIKVPFFGKPIIKKEKVKMPRGYKASMIIIDESSNTKVSEDCPSCNPKKNCIHKNYKMPPMKLKKKGVSK